MAARMNLDRALAGDEFAVDVDAIERSLADLWKAEGEASEAAVTRAALWNVIAHAESDSHRMLAASTLSEVAGAIPQRAIIVHADPRAEAAMSAWISANCTVAGQGRQVCSEEITIVASGERRAHVPSLVRALLIPELPVAAWWIGDLPSGRDEYILDFLDVADRLLIDSHDFDTIDDLKLVEQISRSSATAPADLTWARMQDLFTATASIFDPAENRKLLEEIRSITMTVRDDGTFGSRVESLYYAGWLAAQLGWRVDGSAVVRPSGAEVNFQVEKSSTAGGDRTLVKIRLECGNGVIAEIDRAPGGESVTGVIRNEEALPPVLTRSFDRGAPHLLSRLLSHTYDDRVYGRVLPVARAMDALVR